ncbi:MAG: hypothetical protein LUG55_08090 [Clostridiales bacterium]|nr:hypothetical protein [Clostridiales bacterium]
MAKLYALDYIQYGMARYEPGDFLPVTATLADAWVEAGSARWVDDDFTPATYPKAKRATAEPGLFGLAEGGEQTGDDLVGKVPRAIQRERGHRRKWKP